MRRAALNILMISALLATPQAALAKDEFKQNLGDEYAACTGLVKTDAEQAYKKARAWMDETGAMAAQHCKALALFEMGDYAGSARELDAILKSVTPGQRRLWLNMKIQAAKAHMYAQNFIGGETHLTEALRWASEQQGMEADMVPMLIQRARIYALHNEHLRAINDLDHALSIKNDKDVLLERARTFVKMGKPDSALDDVKAVLKEDPLNEQASSMLSKIEQAMNKQGKKKKKKSD